MKKLFTICAYDNEGKLLRYQYENSFLIAEALLDNAVLEFRNKGFKVKKFKRPTRFLASNKKEKTEWFIYER